MTAYLLEPGRIDDLVPVLVDIGTARAVFAEDFDDFGSLWAVLSVEDGRATTLHHRYVLNADPADADAVEAAVGDLGDDPRSEDVGGTAAATAAAELFGAEPAAMVAAEEGSATAYEQIGVIGGAVPVVGRPRAAVAASGRRRTRQRDVTGGATPRCAVMRVYTSGRRYCSKSNSVPV